MKLRLVNKEEKPFAVLLVQIIETLKRLVAVAPPDLKEVRCDGYHDTESRRKLRERLKQLSYALKIHKSPAFSRLGRRGHGPPKLLEHGSLLIAQDARFVDGLRLTWPPNDRRGRRGGRLRITFGLRRSHSLVRHRVVALTDS